MSSIEVRSASILSSLEEAGSRATQPSDWQLQAHTRSVGASLDYSQTSPVVEPQSSYWEPAPEMRTAFHSELAQARNIARVPRITIGAFCEDHHVFQTLEIAARDRMMSRTSIETYAGGIKAAVEFCRHNPVPNLLIVESKAPNDVVLAELEGLADVCDPGTRVLVIGYSNDISFYRDLMSRGISEYVVAPVSAVQLIATISRIYRSASSGKLGKVYAFVGAKGGVGSSTVAHNVGWTMGRRFGSDVVLADLDLPFGTAGLDFNLDVSQGLAEIIQDSSRLDEVLFDRLLTKCDDHFSLLAAPAKLDRPYDLDANTFEGLLEVAQANVPFTILDIPHLWTSWAMNALVAADEIVITAAPDLANLRNAKNLISFLKQTRPHDAAPRLVLNQVGMAKRPEIKRNEFARALELEPLACIAFDAQLFGTAANNGKMIADTSAKSPIASAFVEVATAIAGRNEMKVQRRKLLDRLTFLRRSK